MKVVATSTKVRGSDTRQTRERRGELTYHMELEGKSTIKIGSRRHFKIIPTSPGLVYATVTDCAVKSDQAQQYKLAEMKDTKQICTDLVTQFNNTDVNWSSTGDLRFSYTAFRWSTGTDEVRYFILPCNLQFCSAYRKAANRVQSQTRL